EGETCAVVPFERHGMSGREISSIDFAPGRRLVGQLQPALIANPPEVRVVGKVGVLWRQKNDLGALGIDGLAILLEPQIIETRALEQQRAVDRRRADDDARSCGTECLAARE